MQQKEQTDSRFNSRYVDYPIGGFQTITNKNGATELNGTLLEKGPCKRA